MIPENRFSSHPFPARLINPWSENRAISYHMGPISLGDISRGLLHKLWSARVVVTDDREGSEIYVTSQDGEEILQYTHPSRIREISLAFDQNGHPNTTFVSESGIPYLYWYDPLIPGMTILELDQNWISPRITLDDARQVNISNSDIILGYVRGNLLRYRRQRDRWGIEYTPTIGVGGPSASAHFLKHISMNSGLRLEFIHGDVEDPFIFLQAMPDYDQIASGRSGITSILDNDLYYGKPVKLEDLDDLPKVTRKPIIGSVSVNPDGTITFTAPRGFRGVISYEYEIKASPLED